MPEIRINNFSKGWTPCSDPVNGDRAGLLQMNNLELDTNGALSLAGGTQVKSSGYSAAAHTLFSRTINNTRCDYAALADGSIWRNGASIGAGGDSSNAAFSTAFNFTLISSGNTRLKDSGSGAPVTLGINPPSAAPNIGVSPSQSSTFIGSLINNIFAPVGSIQQFNTPFKYIQATCAAGTFAIQTYIAAMPAVNLNQVTLLNAFGIGHNLVSAATDLDYITVCGYTPIVAGRSLRLDILLTPGDAAADVVSSYYTYTITDLSTVTFTAQGEFIARIPRSAFVLVGQGSWTYTYGFRITYTGGTGAEVVNLFGLNTLFPNLYMSGGSNALNGQYQYLQINVNNTGSYEAQSAAISSPQSSPVNILMAQPFIVPNPIPNGDQANEVWIYRNGGNLNGWYRVIVFNSTTGFTGQFDTLSDQSALELDLTLNFNLISIASSSITDKIYDIIGPVSGRWYYFTTNFMYPSDINDPDLVDASLAIRICGSSSELFMWARKVAPQTMVVGTSIDIYTLSGTFETLPDFTIDAYYLPSATKYPPITCDAEVWGGSVFYLASDGWRVLNGTGQASFTGNTNTSLVSPNLDRLYRGENVQGYQAPNLKILPRSTRFPVVIAKNKLFCFITGIAVPRIEVYDFIRQYWRPVLYGLGDFSAACVCQDGTLIAFCSGDSKIRELDYQGSRKIDTTTNQIVTIKTMVWDADAPRQRKDFNTFKMRVENDYTIVVNIIPDGSNSQTNVGSINTNTFSTDNYLDLSSTAVCTQKTYQLVLTSSPSDLILEDISIQWDNPRPEQRTFLRIPSTNFGTAAKKRLRTWPFMIDTLGNVITVVPDVDGVNDTADQTTFTTPASQASNGFTRKLYFKTDVQGVDYGVTFYAASGGLFEYYGSLPPEVAQTFPVATRYWQMGPQEIFRYGKILQIALRISAHGTAIPWNVFFQDGSLMNGVFNINEDVDSVYYTPVTKGTSGNILRVEFGPVNFDMHIFSARAKVVDSGKDTDDNWIDI